jgi:hypothetical protein
LTDLGRPAPPRELSKWAKQTWRTLLELNTFEGHEVVTLARALEWWDKSDRLNAESEAASGPERVHLLRLAMDANSSALRCWRTLKFASSAAVPRRPGRPSGDNWNEQRKQAAKQATDLRGLKVHGDA